jgi:hypothetical protein
MGISFLVMSAAARSSPARWLLFLLHLLGLLRVGLLQTLRLLLVLLLHLLRSLGTSLLFRQLLMLIVLLLLEFLPILGLPGDQLILLLVVFLVHLGVPRLRHSGAFDGRQFLRMDGKDQTKPICFLVCDRIARLANHTQTPLLLMISSVETKLVNASGPIRPSALINRFASSSRIVTSL